MPVSLNPDSVCAVLQKQLGIRLLGDTELNIWAGAPSRVADQISSTTISSAVSSAPGLASSDATNIQNHLSGKKISK
jgi:hypothetical protein